MPMEQSPKTARALFEELRQAPPRKLFGFGRKAALINIDVQRAYTDTATFKTAYETDPQQIAHINALAEVCRSRGLPVIWTYVAYEPGEAGVWGTRSDTPDALQNIALGSPRAELDPRTEIDRPYDVIIRKRMASAFFETNLASLAVWHGIDTMVVTGGSTSGCVRATAVDGLSHGYRMIVPQECVADKHESPHFASLYDMHLKYADVLPVDQVQAALRKMGG